jgi:CrcB protein
MPPDSGSALPPGLLRRPASAARPRRWDLVLVIAAGGAVGGTMRHAVSLVLEPSPSGFPWGTFVENVTGCLLLAVLLVYLMEVWPPSRYVRPFLGVGVLGGFTTFSTFTNETRDLLLDGEVLVALSYVAATLVVGLLATWFGLRAARQMAGVGRAR